MPEEESSLNKFIENFAALHTVPSLTESVMALVQQFNEGAPFAPVSASDLKQLWEVTKRIKADFPSRPEVAIGGGIFASYGIDFVNEPERFTSATYRLEILSDLLGRGVLKDYVHGERVDENVFSAAASMPCNKNDLAQVMIPRLLAESPADVAAKATEEMLAGGFDPASPNIDQKFLDWLRTNC
jgi:hypothetical protein